MVGLSESARRAVQATEVEQASKLEMSDIYCAPSTVHGWGVFAGRDFRRGEILHESPGRLIEGLPECITDDVFATTQVLWESEAGYSHFMLGSCRANTPETLRMPSSEPNRNTVNVDRCL